MANNPTVTQRLRQFLRSDIKGKFTTAMLEAFAVGDNYNEENIQALKQNLFIATAEDKYLDKLTSALGIIRPAGVGIDNDAYRSLAISINNTQAVSNIFLEVLELFYGIDAVRANVISTIAEPYALVDGMTLTVQVDKASAPLTVIFNASDFANISTATSIEVATVIARAAVQANYNLTASDFADISANQTFIQLFSKSRGPTSSVTVTGGSAQNIFRFPAIKPTTQTAGTEFTVTVEGGFLRYTWTAGVDPTLQNISEGDYVNIASPPFTPEQYGTFTITKVNPDVMGSGYFEVINPIVQTNGSYTLASDDNLRFFKPKRSTINDLTRFATIYEVNPYELVIYIPATTKIVKRSLIGSWHIHPDGNPENYIGSYCFNPKSGVSISSISAQVNQTITAGQPYTVIGATGSTVDFPDETGYIVFEFGTSNEEGPVRYLGRPSSNTLLLDASYVFKKTHINSDITLLRSTKPYHPAVDGTDYATYLTGTVQGRLEAERLSNELAAAGIFISVIIVYPSGVGLNDVEAVYAGDVT
jgi:hypothetical protein